MGRTEIPSTVGKVHSPHGGAVVGECLGAEPLAIIGSVRPPHAHAVVVAGRDEGARVVGVEADHLDVLRVLGEHGQTLKLGIVVFCACRVPRTAAVLSRIELPDPHRLVAAAARQQPPVRAPRHTLHLVLMALQVCDARPATPLARRPHGHDALEARRCETSAVRREGHAAHGAGVGVAQLVRQVPARLATAPDPDHEVLATARQPPAGWVPINPPHRPLVSFGNAQAAHTHAAYLQARGSPPRTRVSSPPPPRPSPPPVQGS